MRVTCGVDQELKDVLLTVPVGRLDANGATAFSEAIYPRLNETTRSLLVDMSGLDYVSSAGIGILIQLLTRARQLNGAISVFGANTSVRGVMKIVAIEAVLNVRGTVEDARARLKELGAS